MKKLIQMTVSMLKIGLIGFGGGNALIPVIQKEIVEEKGLITGEEYEKDIVAAALTPGALPVEIAAGVGKNVAGKKGMILAAVAMAFPGAALTILMMAGMDGLNNRILTQIQYASIGITAFIMCLLTEYIHSAFQDYIVKRHRMKAWGVCLGVFVLTAGRYLYRIFQVDATPLFSISTIEMLAIAFFAILVTDCKFNWQKMMPVCIVAAVYLLCIGKAKVIDNSIVTWTIRGVMIVLSIHSFVKSSYKKKKKRKKMLKPIVMDVTAWLCFALILSLPAWLYFAKDTSLFFVKGVASSLISFGGGDAYLTIADGLFVPDYISESSFYNYLILIVNILPGSILCKTLSGIGYAYGVHVSGMTLGGFWMAAVGFAVSVMASAAVFDVIYHLYEYLENIDVFINIKKSIKVIVSGLLLTVMTGLIQSSMTLGQNKDYPWFTILIMIFAIYGLNLFLLKKAKCKNLLLIGMSLVLSMGLCNAMGV
ncbi:MAG: chromate transporter [Eubacterium sp.]|nr:chromate transporter [Eubacterium sp.]